MPAAHRRCDPSFPDFCVLFAGTGGAEWRFAAAQRSEVQSQLEALNKQKALTPVEKLSQQDLTRTLELLDAIERNRQDAAQLKQQVQQAPAKLNQVTAELDALKRPTDNAAARAALSVGRCRCASWKAGCIKRSTSCKARRRASPPTTANWCRCKPSLNGCRAPCTPLRSACRRSAASSAARRRGKIRCATASR